MIDPPPYASMILQAFNIRCVASVLLGCPNPLAE